MRQKAGMLMAFLLISVAFSGCFKDDSEEKRAEERALLNEYLTDLENQGVEVEKESGYYYVVHKEGTGETAGYAEFVELQITARVLEGDVFATTDRDTAEKYDIVNEAFLYGKLRYLVGNGLTRGINMGLQLMKDSSQFTFYVPSDLGYGDNDYTAIPAYSTLQYDVTMIKAIKDPAEYERSLLNKYLEEMEIAKEDSTDSGLYFQWIEESNGAGINSGNKVNVRYTGMLVDGRVFGKTNSTETIEIVAGSDNNIDGFNEGLLNMKVGSKARFIMPYYLGYGFEGYNSIPYFSSLVFEVEAVSIE